VFITGEGDPVRGTLQWPAHPLSTCKRSLVNFLAVEPSIINLFIYSSTMTLLFIFCLLDWLLSQGHRTNNYG